jgi:hypothetical protein
MQFQRVNYSEQGLFGFGNAIIGVEKRVTSTVKLMDIIQQ